MGSSAGGARSRSPFLEGNFAPVHEEVTIDRLEVMGEIPRELRGMFVRNGPNPQFATQRKLSLVRWRWDAARRAH